MGTLSIFWVASLNNTKYLLNIAFEIKDTIFKFTHFELPIPDKFKHANDIYEYIRSLFNHKS